jgi:N utilization substance protein B
MGLAAPPMSHGRAWPHWLVAPLDMAFGARRRAERVSWFVGLGSPSNCMARRSRAREVALQVLFQDDLNPGMNPAAADTFLKSRLPDAELVAFAQSLVAGVRRNRGELDSLLSRTADNWSLERMAATDRNILRLGAYEILYTEVPGRVAINEAVELAKRFGTGHSAQFVNGILDQFLAGHGGSTSDQ